jgi:hypothetical protein
VARVYKLHAINSDGSETEEKLIPFIFTDPATGNPYLDAQGEPEIVVYLRPISPSKSREVERDHTRRQLNKQSRAMEEVVDWEAVQDDLIAYTIQSWKGLVGADDQPLQCVLDAKLGLPGDLKNDLLKRAMQGEAVHSPAVSFRATA